MRNKLAVMCLTLATMFCANAATWIDPDSGIEWTYSISNGEAKVEDLNSPSLSKGYITISDPSVEITVPRRLGGCPVTIIGNRAFSCCQGLVRVEIPDGVKTIEDSAFESCYNLRKVKIPESVTKIAYGAFIYCSALEDMTLPSQMRNIEEYTFSRCFKLKRVEMGHCVTNIAWNAFEACMALEYINFPVGLRSIGENAFQYCLSLRLVMLPRSVEHLKDRSFMQCANLMKVVVGTGIKSIGNNVFDKCENLRSVVFCGDAPVMGESVFTNVDYRCTAYVKNGADGWGEVPGKWEYINTAYLDADDNGYNGETPGTMFSWMITEYPYASIAGPMSYNGTCPVVTIPSRISTDILDYDKDVDSLPVRTIEDFTFKDCSHLKSAIIPESVVKIGTSAFEGCRSLKQIKFEGYDHLLIETKLGTNVFADVASGCTAYDSHKRIFSCVFDPVEWHYTLDSEGLLIGDPDSFKEITDEYSGGYGGMRKESQFHMMYHLTSGGIGIERYHGTESVVNIPSHLNCMGFNDPVAYIEAGAFENCGFLTEVTFSKRVKSIGSRAFYGCKSLKRVIFKGQPPVHISENAFEGVHPDCTVYVPHDIEWAKFLYGAIWKGPKLEYYSIPKAVNEDEVAEVLAGATDPSVAKNIKSVKEYNDYQEWAMGLPGASLQQVMDSPFAWLSYVFNTENLIAAAPKEGDVIIDTFENAATDGAFEFTVNMKDIAVGDGALEANIRKVFDIEGATELRSDGTSDGGFSSDNVEVSAAVPANGHVKFTVSPKVGKGESGTGNGEKSGSFFFRVKMK